MSKSSKAAREVNGNNQLVADISDTCEKAIDRPLVTTGYYSARTMTGRTICVCVQGVCVFCSSRLWRKILRTGCPTALFSPLSCCLGNGADGGGGCCSSSQTWYFVSMMDVCMRTSDSLKGHRHAQPWQKCSSMHRTAPHYYLLSLQLFFIDCV